MKVVRIATAVLLTASFATPSFANWFDNFMVGPNQKKLVASAASPTPDDLRAIGDSKYGEGKTYHFNPKDGHWHEDKPAPAPNNPPGPATSPAGADIAPAP